MAGAPHLGPEGIETAVLLLKGWAGKLTWETFIALLAVEVGHAYSKTALSKHSRIREEFSAAKTRLRNEAEGLGGLGSGSSSALGHVRKLLEEAKRDLAAEREARQLQNEQFLRWQFNAERHGVKYAQLNAPLPNPKGPKDAKGKK